MKAKFALKDGEAAFNMCWLSRQDPCINFTCKVSYLDKNAAEKRHLDTKARYKEDIKPGRALRFQDLDLSYFCNDSRML